MEISSNNRQHAARHEPLHAFSPARNTQGTFKAGVRRVVEEAAAALGVHVGTSVTKGADYLVVGGVAAAHGSKEDDAARLGVRVLSEVEWDELVATQVFVAII
jgi:NAD-dependent DNA ligase